MKVVWWRGVDKFFNRFFNHVYQIIYDANGNIISDIDVAVHPI